MTGFVCKGDPALGTACGRCERCRANGATPRPRLNAKSVALLREHAETLEMIGSRQVATALAMLLEWHEAGR